MNCNFNYAKSCKKTILLINITKIITSEEAIVSLIENNEEKIVYTFEFNDILFKVTVTFDERISFNFSFINNTEKYVEWVIFPQIAVPNDLVKNGGSGRLVLDINEGLLVEDIRAKETYGAYKYREPEYPSQGLDSIFPAAVESQFMSYYDRQAGLYICAEDADRATKGINFEHIDDNAIRLEMRLYPGVETNTKNYQLPFSIVYDFFEGDWHDAAELYRTWFEKNPPAELKKVTNNPDLPKWYFDSPLVVAYPVQGIHDMDEAKPNRLFPYENVFPFLDEFAESCEKEITEKNLKKYMCMPPLGDEPISKTCQAQRFSYDMCISQDFTKKVIWDEAEKIASCGLDYIQILDQNHGGTPYFCYSDKHNHPAVPGKWIVEHNIEFLKVLKEKVGKDILLGCESAAAEAYIPYLNLSDNRFNLNYPAGKPIPLYGYLYHEYLHNFSGNSVCSLFFIDAEKSPDCHLLRVAHSYLAGDLMTIVINQDGEIMWSWGQREFDYLPEREPILKFIKSATEYRRGAGKDYLVFGRMIKPKKVTCEEVPMYNIKMKYDTLYPAVLTTAWKGTDGSKVQFFASYRKVNENCTVDLRNTNGAEIIDANGKVERILPADVYKLTIPPHSIKMIRFI